MSNRQPISTFLGIAAAVVLVSSSYAPVINVGPGDSIQAAIDAAVAGDEIVVAPGTYCECINFLGKAITLRSSDGPEVTVIDAGGFGGCGTVVTCDSGEGANTVLSGFVITGGTGTDFGGFTVGGGMFNFSSSPTVTNCSFSSNTATGFGGGMHNDGLFGPACPVVINCTFSGNTSGIWGGGMYNEDSSPTLTNCTFSGNTADFGGGMVGGIAINCIFWNNDPDQIFGGSAVVAYTDVQGSFPGTGNINADPLFVDPLNGDFRLSPGSPSIDAGDNTAVPLDITTDLDGNRRFVDDPDTLDTGLDKPPIVDMGAYELQVDDDDDDDSSSDSSSDDSSSSDSSSDDSSSGDSSDDCPDDPYKTDPGTCGCGIPDTPDCDQPYPTGWTEFNPSPDTRIVYVSSSEGSDSNSGLSQDQPVRTLARGVSLMRNGFPDWLLLKRGDTWNTQVSGAWIKSGRGVDEPMLISNYGQQSAPRPRIAHTGTGQALVLSTGSPPSFLAIVGIHFDGSNADSTADGFSARGAGSADILVENCLFNGGFDINIHLQDVARVSIRRCVIVDATRQGLFTSHVTDVLIEENVFDDNGTSLTHDHNMYLSHGDSGFIIRNNITARSSNFGLKFRGPVVDSLIQDNIFAANHTMCQIHCKLESEENANIEFTGNIATQSGHTDKAGGLRINSTRHLLVSNNILANSTLDGSQAFKFYYEEAFYPDGDFFQADDVVIQNNTVYAWRGHYVYFGDTPDDAIIDYNDVVIANNLFQGLPEKETGPRFLVAHLDPIELGRVDFFGNRYDSNESANEWFRIDTAPYLSLSEWQVQADEPDGQAIDAQFVDPDRTLATYNQTLGGAPTLDAFLAEARLQSKANWRPEYTAQSIAEYIRAGFTPQADVGTAGAVSPE